MCFEYSNLQRTFGDRRGHLGTQRDTASIRLRIRRFQVRFLTGAVLLAEGLYGVYTKLGEVRVFASQPRSDGTEKMRAEGFEPPTGCV